MSGGASTATAMPDSRTTAMSEARQHLMSEFRAWQQAHPGFSMSSSSVEDRAMFLEYQRRLARLDAQSSRIDQYPTPAQFPATPDGVSGSQASVIQLIRGMMGGG